MYAKYTYAAGTALANLIADVTALLTGTTDKALLSANCDQANTEILTTYDPAGWTLHDAAAGANKIVLSAPHADVGTKHAVLDFNTAGYVFISAAEAWNSTSHVGTNVTSAGSTTNSQRVNLAAGGVLYISASARRLVLFSYQAASFGSSSFNAWTMLAERKRGQMEWDTVAANYPLGFTMTSSPGFSGFGATAVSGALPRLFNPTTGAAVANQAIRVAGPMQGYGEAIPANTNSSGKLFNGAGAAAYVVLPLRLIQISPFFDGGFFSDISNLYALQATVGANLDEIDVLGQTRVVWLSAANNASGSLLVPKG